MFGLTTSFLLSPLAAHAGSYFWTTKDANGNITAQSPSFTGGTVVVVTCLHPISKLPPPPPAFSTSNGQYGGGGGCVTSSVMPGGGPGSVKVNSPANPIVATFTWQASGPNDLPPPAIIVEQDCTAQWQAETITQNATVGGTADCGLPGLPPSVTKDANGNVIGVSSSGTQYMVMQSPGASFTVPAQSGGSYKPTASFTPTAGTGAASGGASINYSIQVFPVVVNLVGTNNPNIGDYRALTGQQITASLVSPSGLPRGTKVTGYTWSFSNNNPIKGWDPNAPGDGQPTQILPLLPTDYIGLPPIGTNISISFYDEIAGDTLTASCAVTLNLPDYSTQTVNAASPQMTFVKPTVKWSVATGYVQLAADPKTGSYGYALGPVPGSQQQGGEAWNNVAISVPAPFYGGQGCFVQLVTPNSTVTNKDPTKSQVFPNNGQRGLDNSFPYRNYTWAVPAPGANIDGPAFIFSNAYNQTADQGFTSVAEHDKFSTWVMYNPPAVGSQGTIWVPLQSYAWEWSFTSVWNGQWPLTTASPMSATDDPHYNPTGVMNIPPQWSMIQTNSQ